MTKLYEALQLAGKKRTVAIGERKKKLGLKREPAPDALEECLLGVHRRIEALLGPSRSRILAFVGVPETADASRIAERFAHSITTRLGKRVLLLSTEAKAGKHIAVSRDRLRQILRGTSSDDIPLEDETLPPHAEAEGGVVVRRAHAMEIVLPLMQDSPQNDHPIAELRRDYDLVVLDAPPLGASPSTEMVAGLADGVVLVVDAGKARWPAVKHGMEQIERLHGRVLGVVLNHYRRYIPDFMYKLL